MPPTPAHIVIVGGGIVGLATALALSRTKGPAITVLEKEANLAPHQTGNNSGVIHSGLYYRPGSLKARLCTAGREALYAFCRSHGVAHERCGKVVVATRAAELPWLETLEQRGRANGLNGLERLSADGIAACEPHIRGIAGLRVPQTGIVDFPAVCRAMADDLRIAGHTIATGERFERLERRDRGFIIHTTGGKRRATFLINCGGLQADRIARRCGVEPGVRIVPFRGEYYKLRSDRTNLVRDLVYPVPDPSFPFLGVHFTRMIHGGVEAGPNAVLAFKREGYRKTAVSLGDLLDTLTYPGFLRLAARYWRTGGGEFYRSFSKAAFVRALQRLLPAIGSADLVPGGAGIRAQALRRDGRLVDDFHIIARPGMVHVLNAPSPAATASIAIGRVIAGQAGRQFGL